jgi:hypothetical protein
VITLAPFGSIKEASKASRWNWGCCRRILLCRWTTRGISCRGQSYSGLSREVQRAAGAPSPDHRARCGELATRMMILAVTPAVLNVISIWLNKKNSGESFEETLSVVGPDGSRKEHKIKNRRNSSKRWVIGAAYRR